MRTIPWSGFSGGSGGSSPSSSNAHAVAVTVDFGAQFGVQASTVVAGQAWVTAESIITATPVSDAASALTAAVLQFSPVVHTLVPGVGFTLLVYAPAGAKGSYTFNCIGVVP